MQTGEARADSRAFAPWLQELSRKSVHVAVSIAVITILWLAPHSLARLIFTSAAILAVGLDTLRLRVPAVRARFLHWFGPMLRDHERTRLTGATTLAAGVAIAVLLFPTSFVIVGVLYAGPADAAGALIGRNFGRHRFTSGKSLEGSLAFLIVAFLIGLAMPGINMFAAAVAAALVTVIEAAPFTSDDNLILPVSGAAATYLAVVLFG